MRAAPGPTARKVIPTTTLDQGALDHALAHIARGWATLPVTPGKQPVHRLIRATRGHASWRQLAERPASADEVRDWFELEPGTGIGVITGEPSGGLVVVDVDNQAIAPDLPETASVATTRGSHHYFGASERVATRSFPWGELKADGAYVVAPASRAESGRRYRWELSPEDVEIERFDPVILALGQVGTYVTPKASTLRASPGTGSTCLRPSSSRACVVESAARLANLERDEQTALRLAAALGAPSGLRLGRTFRCLLHPDRSPSASLWRREEHAHVLYRDWHGRDSGEWLTLAHVRARLAGRDGALAVPELTVWKLRLAAEAGLLEPADLSLELGDAPGELVGVWEGFLRLLALRWTIEPGIAAPFSARFAAAWCEVSKREAHEAVRELARLGLLRHAGLDERGTRLWLPEGVGPTS